MSISSLRVRVTERPAPANSKSPSIVTIRSTVDSVPLGRTLILSPGETVPLPINPAKPRKSRLGRFTHCTGILKGRDCEVAETSTLSKYSIIEEP